MNDQEADDKIELQEADSEFIHKVQAVQNYSKQILDNEVRDLDHLER